MTIKFVAEIGSNWDPERPQASITELFMAAGRAGADYVKLQDFSPISEMDRPDWWKESSEPWELDGKLLSQLMNTAYMAGTQLFTSVFTYQATRRAHINRFPYIKVASGEIFNHTLLANVGTTGLPVILSVSSGKATKIDDLEASLSFLAKRRHVTLLYCLADYPADASFAMETMEPALDALKPFATAGIDVLPQVGWSSHVAWPGAVKVAVAAVSTGAQMIEMHLRMDGVTPDGAPDNDVWSLYPEQFKSVVEAVRTSDVRV